MNYSYFTNFKLEPGSKILVFGDRYKITLIRQLALECVKAGYHALITSMIPETYPVEGKVLVTDDVSLLPNLIKDDPPEVIYLAGKVRDDLLQPLEPGQINQLAKLLGDNLILFTIIDPEHQKNLSGIKFLKQSRLVCSLNFNLLKENLPELSKLKDLKRKSSSEQVSEQIFNLISSLCSKFIELETKSDKVCYIGQVKGMFDENVILPVIRNLKDYLKCRMLIGDINSYHIKEV